MLNGIQIVAPLTEDFSRILTPKALNFVSTIVSEFAPRREELLRKREDRQSQIDAGVMPDFLKETENIRTSSWNIAPVPTDLQDRRVEITGPSADAKMVINAFNSGANVYMSDFEDSQTPTWENTIQGQIYLRDAITKSLHFVSPEGKTYSLNKKVSTLMVRPRGWHLLEKHVLFNGKPVSASLLDFCLFFFHNAQALIAQGTGPYFYLPKLESHLEARLWNDVFVRVQSELGIPQGTIKVTVLIETILASFEMDEILFELKEHSAGLNCGRWDYIFSFIKKFSSKPEFVLPDRALITMDKGFLSAYVNLLIKTCHRRRAHAIGGMAAQIPIKGDEGKNQIAFDKVRADKEREVQAGHDGTWVAHPGLVGLAQEVFDAGMKAPNQLNRLREDVHVSAADLLAAPEGEVTELGLRTNLFVGITYLESWLKGIGCVPINHLMEDAATAEICRAQVWQWVHHRVTLADRKRIDLDFVRQALNEECDRIRSAMGQAKYDSGQYKKASDLFEGMIVNPRFVDFLTLGAYDCIS